MFCEVYHVLFSRSRVRLGVGDPARAKRRSQWGGGFYGYRLKFWLFYGYRPSFFSYG